jgi:cytochrome c-type biogenesis protein CcmH/NrfG
MRAASAALLILGFAVGFFAMNKYITHRAVEITKPIPQFSPRRAASPASAPKADPAVISKLEGELKNDPKNFEALRELGNIRYDERNFTEAAALYARALEVHPDDVNVRSDRGGALLQGGRVDDAIGELKTVLSKDATHPQALYVMGVALLNGKNDREGAVASWKRLVETHPELPELNIVKDQIKQLEEATRRK